MIRRLPADLSSLIVPDTFDVGTGLSWKPIVDCSSPEVSVIRPPRSLTSDRTSSEGERAPVRSCRPAHRRCR